MLSVSKVRWFFSITALLLLTACPSGEDSAVETMRETQIYRTVIADLAEEFEVRDLRPDREPVLYIESFETEGLPLKVQVELVGEFLDVYDVRFVDTREEALDDEFVALPVRAGGVLIGLGPILDDGDTTVRVELYADDIHIRAWQYQLDNESGPWEIVGSRTGVTPRGFVAR